MKRSDFATILDHINDGPPYRRPAGVSPAVCEIWRQDEERQRVIDSILAFERRTMVKGADGELTGGRPATIDDMEQVAAINREMDAQFSAARARTGGETEQAA